MDLFPTDVSDIVVPLFTDAELWEKEILSHHVTAFIVFQEESVYQRVFHKVLDDTWTGQFLDAAMRCLGESKQSSYFNPDALKWEKISKRLQRCPDRALKNADTRMAFKLDHMFLVKHGFTFGHWKVPEGQYHVYQTSAAAMVCYQLPEASVNSRSEPNTYRRAFPEFDQYLYTRYVWKPFTTYHIPSGTRYLIMTVQKTLFSVDITQGPVLGSVPFNRDRLMQKPTSYNVPPPTPRREEEGRPSKRVHKRQEGIPKRQEGFKIPKLHQKFKIPKRRLENHEPPVFREPQQPVFREPQQPVVREQPQQTIICEQPQQSVFREQPVVHEQPPVVPEQPPVFYEPPQQQVFYEPTVFYEQPVCHEPQPVFQEPMEPDDYTSPPSVEVLPTPEPPEEPQPTVEELAFEPVTPFPSESMPSLTDLLESILTEEERNTMRLDTPMPYNTLGLESFFDADAPLDLSPSVRFPKRKTTYQCHVPLDLSCKRMVQ